MGLFGRKKKNDEVQEAPEKVTDTAGTGASGGASAPKKRKKDRLDSVLQESVVENVMDDFRLSDKLSLTYEGQKAFWGMLLNVDDIGGMGQSARRDESKGAAIEMMNSRRIKVFVPEELLSNEKLIIIPDAATLDAMSEFGMLMQAPYHVAIVYPDGRVQQTDHPIMFMQAQEILTKESAIITGLLGMANEEQGAVVEENVNEYVQPTGKHVAPEPESASLADAPTQTMNAVAGDLEMDDLPVDVPDMDEGPQFEDEVPGSEDDDFLPADGDFEMGDEGDIEDETESDDADDEEEVVEITQEQFDEALTRRFYSDDLGLEVNTDAFDSSFLHNNVLVPFNEERAEGWLNNHLNELAREANLDLQSHHQQNLMSLRQNFFILISAGVEQITEQLSLDNPEGEWSQRKGNLEEARDRELDAVEDQVVTSRHERNEAFEKKVAQAGEAARVAAEQAYRDRWERAHDGELNRLDTDLREAIHSRFAQQMRDLKNDRREEASRRLDALITETLTACQPIYEQAMQVEMLLREEWAEKIRNYINEYRDDDIARSKALAEELAQAERADKVRREFTEKMQAQTAEFDAMRSRFESDVARIQREADAKIAANLEETNKRLADAKVAQEELQGRFNEVLDRYTALDAKKTEEFQHRLVVAEDERKAWETKCDNLIKAQRKNSFVAIGLATVSIIAALAVGVLVGFTVNANYSMQDNVDQTQVELRKRLDNLDEKVDDARKSVEDQKSGSTEPSKTPIPSTTSPGTGEGASQSGDESR